MLGKGGVESQSETAVGSNFNCCDSSGDRFAVVIDEWEKERKLEKKKLHCNFGPCDSIGQTTSHFVSHNRRAPSHKYEHVIRFSILIWNSWFYRRGGGGDDDDDDGGAKKCARALNKNCLIIPVIIQYPISDTIKEALSKIADCCSRRRRRCQYHRRILCVFVFVFVHSVSLSIIWFPFGVSLCHLDECIEFVLGTYLLSHTAPNTEQPSPPSAYSIPIHNILCFFVFFSLLNDFVKWNSNLFVVDYVIWINFDFDNTKIPHTPTYRVSAIKFDSQDMIHSRDGVCVSVSVCGSDGDDGT